MRPDAWGLELPPNEARDGAYNRGSRLRKACGMSIGFGRMSPPSRSRMTRSQLSLIRAALVLALLPFARTTQAQDAPAANAPAPAPVVEAAPTESQTPAPALVA